MFGTYPSSLLTSDIPVQGLVAALRQAEKQRQAASQVDIEAADVAQMAGASREGEMEGERELQASRR